jgi:hypothetical protein
MRKFLLLLFIACTVPGLRAQIRVSDNHRFLQTQDGKPFFWLGDTDWEMVHRLKRDEISQLIRARKAFQRFAGGRTR